MLAIPSPCHTRHHSAVHEDGWSQVEVDCPTTGYQNREGLVSLPACLIDPAAYGGHREVDLAMMRLFGGFGPRVFAAYEEAWPLHPGHQERVPLYQLYFLMVHVNLFGGPYVAQAQRALLAIA